MDEKFIKISLDATNEQRFFDQRFLDTGILIMESAVNLTQWVSFLQRGSDANDDSNGSNDTATDDLQIPSVDVENPDHGPPEPVALECGPQNDGAELRTTEAHDAKFL
eukprot:gene13517-14927_t